MTAATIARPARSTRAKAAQADCRRAVLAYHSAIEELIKVADLDLDATSRLSWIEFAQAREAEAEQALVDSLVLGGRPFEHEGFRYSAGPDEAGQTFILNIETL